MSLTAFEAAARYFEPPERVWATPGDIARHVTPDTIQTPALDLIDQALVEVFDQPDGRLIITMPPQEGKSTRVAKHFPIWALTQNKNLRIVTASYGQNLANRNGRAIRNTITANPELGLQIAPDNGSVSEWTLNGHEGGVLSVGIGAGVTGRPADCVTGDTYIECEHGRLTVEAAFSRGIQRIRAYDHTTGRVVWRDVEAARRISGRRVVEVVTESGRTITCTPDHLVYTRRGYVPAGTLRAGDTLTALVGTDRMPVRQRAGYPEDGSSQSDQARTGPLLLGGLHAGRDRGVIADALLQVWSPSSAQPSFDVFGRMLARGSHPAGTGVRAVRAGFPAQARDCDVLLAGLRERGALGTHDRQGQRPLQGREVLREVVPHDPADDLGTRQSPVRGLRSGANNHVSAQGRDGHEVWTHGASHRRGQGEQQAVESDHAMRGLPHEAPQVIDDAVSVVREVRDGEVAVYDFQVAGTSNFFGNDLLVHNCLIIDDPVKDRKEADSETYRENVWEWWTDSASTRLAPGAPVIVILTRWHEDDLAGKLLAAEDGHLWRVVNIPAQADHDPKKGETDALGREPGEFMISARGRTSQQWKAIQIRSGSRTWSSLYQGRPSPASGDIIKREWWQRYDAPLHLIRDDGSCYVTGFDELIASWDLTFKDTKGSDYVVGQVWGRRDADAYLLDQVRDRMDFPATVAAVRRLSAKWPQAVLKLVEDKANGPAVIASLSRSVAGIVPEEPQGSKVARASAVAPLIEAGNVFLPSSELAPWADDLIDEAAAFPNGKHDDQVDALSQGLNRLILQPLLAGDDFAEHPDDHDIDDEMSYWGTAI